MFLPFPPTNQTVAWWDIVKALQADNSDKPVVIEPHANSKNGQQYYFDGEIPMWGTCLRPIWKTFT